MIDTWPYIFCTFRFKTILNHRSNILQIYANQSRGSSYVVVCSWDLQQPVKSVPITINVVGSNPVHGEVYSIQHYVIKFVSDLRQVRSFLWVLRFPPPIKLTPRYNWNIIESGVNQPIHLINHMKSLRFTTRWRSSSLVFQWL